MEYTKKQLIAWGFERHGYGTLFGYGSNGFAGSWVIREHRDLFKLPDQLIYIWHS